MRRPIHFLINFKPAYLFLAKMKENDKKLNNKQNKKYGSSATIRVVSVSLQLSIP